MALLLLPNEDKDIVQSLIQIKNELHPEVKTYQQQIHEQHLESTPLEKAEQKHQQMISVRQKIKPQVKEFVIHTFENYRDSVIDIGNIQCDIMNWIWQGDEFEHIAGARTLQELKQNRRLVNYAIERVISTLTCDSLREWEMTNLWNLKSGHKN